MRSDSSYLTSVASTQPIQSNQIRTVWTATKTFLGREAPEPDQIQQANCSITLLRSMNRLMNRAAKTWAKARTRAKRTRPGTYAHSVDVTRHFRESCAWMPTYIYTMGLSLTSAPSLGVGKPSVRSKIFAFTWESMSMRDPSSAHKVVERVSGPKVTCETTNVATLETSKLILITIWTQFCYVAQSASSVLWLND